MIFRIGRRFSVLMGFLVIGNLSLAAQTGPATGPAQPRAGDDRETRERKIAFNQAIQAGDDSRAGEDIRAALEHYSVALKAARLLASDYLEAVARSRIGDLWLAAGQTAKAIYAYQKSLKLHLDSKSAADAIHTNLKLGYASYMQSDFATSLKYYTETLALARAANNRPAQLDALQSLGNLHRALGHLPLAREHLEAALPLATHQGWRQASIHVNLASVYNAMAESESARRYAQQGLAAGQALQRPSVLWHAHLELGIVALAMGNPNEAFQHYRTTIEILESPAARIEPLGPAIEFITPKAQPYELLVTGLGSLYQQQPNADLRREAFVYAERERLQAVVNALESYLIRVPYRRGDIDWATRESRLRADLIKTMIDLRAATLTQPARADLLQRFQTQSAEYAKFVQEVRAHDPFYASLAYPVPYTPEEVQARVLNRSNTAILAYFLAEPASYVWLLTKTNFQWYQIPGHRDLEAAMADFRQELMSSSDAPSFVENGQKLYQALIGPVQGDLVGVHHLIIVPHGALYTLPFEALYLPSRPTPQPGKLKALVNKLFGGEGDSKWHYLLENYSVSASSSVSALGFVQFTRGQRTRDMENLLAFANPSPRPTSRPGLTDDSSLSLGSGFRGLEEGAKFSVEEIQTIGKLFPRKSERLLIGEEGKESELKKAIASYYRIIHFAVPAAIDARIPSLSTLVLAPDSAEKEDGNLDLSEIFGLTLNADLVTLSSAEVSSGEAGPTSGTDPLAGVEPLAVATRAFIQAGASTVLVSLWPLNQYSRVEFMQDFYANLLSGMSKQEALHLAKRHQLKSVQASHSYYWSGFVLYGDADTVLFLPQPVSKFQVAAIILGFLLVTYLVIRLYYGKRSTPKTG